MMAYHRSTAALFQALECCLKAQDGSLAAADLAKLAPVIGDVYDAGERAAVQAFLDKALGALADRDPVTARDAACVLLDFMAAKPKGDLLPADPFELWEADHG